MVQQHLEDREALKKLTSLVEEVKVCMLATVKEDNTIYSRPMQTIKADENGSLWFFTNEYSKKVEEVEEEHDVYLIYSHPGKNTYLHVKGVAAVVTDKAKMAELWSPIIKAWFPQGLEDPALALLKVNAKEASYWDGSSSKFVVLFNMVKAIATGKQPDEGEYGELKID